MEKLQRALQKARENRGGAKSVSGPRGRSAATDQIWEELTPFDPDPKVLTRNRVVTYSANRDAMAFDVLRTKIILHMRKNGWRRLAITSATPGCGKSTLACNIAVGLSRQPDTRALLVELDLRRPSIASILGATPPHDISEMLSGSVPFADQALRMRQNVALALASRPATDPMKYLLSETTQSRFKEIEARYKPDLVIFDLPPMAVGGDTTALLANVDCAMVVALAEKSTIGQIDACEREMAEHTNVLGVVLNQYRFGEDLSDYGYEKAV